MLLSWLLIVSFCWVNCVEIALKRLLRVWALVTSSWRADRSLGLDAAVCRVAKNELSTEDRPVVLSDSTLSTAPTWSRYALASLLSAVLFW